MTKLSGCLKFTEKIKVSLFLLGVFLILPSSCNTFNTWLRSIRFGRAPPFNIADFVQDENREVPPILFDLAKLLTSPEACIPGLFGIDPTVWLTESLYRDFMKQRQLPTNLKIEEAASLFLAFLYHMPEKLISFEAVEALARLQAIGSSKIYTSSVQRIFNTNYPKFATLDIVYNVFKNYGKNFCDKQGYIGLSKNVAKAIAPAYKPCSWLFRCREISRDFIIAYFLAHMDSDHISGFSDPRATKFVNPGLISRFPLRGRFPTFPENGINYLDRGVFYGPGPYPGVPTDLRVPAPMANQNNQFRHGNPNITPINIQNSQQQYIPPMLSPNGIRPPFPYMNAPVGQRPPPPVQFSGLNVQHQQFAPMNGQVRQQVPFNPTNGPILQHPLHPPVNAQNGQYQQAPRPLPNFQLPQLLRAA